jgi:hypothetical protein
LAWNKEGHLIGQKTEITRKGNQSYLLIFKRDQRRRGKEEILIEGGQDPPSLLNLAPTSKSGRPLEPGNNYAL